MWAAARGEATVRGVRASAEAWLKAVESEWHWQRQDAACEDEAAGVARSVLAVCCPLLVVCVFSSDSLPLPELSRSCSLLSSLSPLCPSSLVQCSASSSAGDVRLWLYSACARLRPAKWSGASMAEAVLGRMSVLAGREGEGGRW